MQKKAHLIISKRGKKELTQGRVGVRDKRKVNRIKMKEDKKRQKNKQNMIKSLCLFFSHLLNLSILCFREKKAKANSMADKFVVSFTSIHRHNGYFLGKSINDNQDQRISS